MDELEEAQTALLKAIKVKAEHAQRGDVNGGTLASTGAALRDFAEAYAWLTAPSQSH